MSKLKKGATMTNHEKITRAIIRAGFDPADFTIYTNTGTRGENIILHNADKRGRTHQSAMSNARTVYPIDGIKKMAVAIKNCRFGYRAQKELTTN